jgi:hypothetical protein
MKRGTPYKELMAGVLGFVITFALVYTNVTYTQAAGLIFPLVIGLVGTVLLISVLLTGRMP